MKYNFIKINKLFYNKISKIFLIIFLYIKIPIKFDVLNKLKINREIKLINHYYNLNNKGLLNYIILKMNIFYY